MRSARPGQAEGLKRLRVGHTPDMDDAFMFYAIASGAIPMNGLQFDHIVEDIQSLNRRALAAELDMTAVSAASYPALAKDYRIVSVGASVGQGYGPLVVSAAPQHPQELAGRRVAVPGLQTTALMVLRLAVPGCVPVEMSFERIPEAVRRGEVDAGVVIHEWQLTYRDAGLLPVLDLGLWWQQRFRLPLPLGLNIVKRSLGLETARRAATVLRESILYAFAHQEEALAYALRYGRGTDAARARQFIGMYVNEESLALSRPCREALRTLFGQAAAAGLIPVAPRLDVVLPG